MSMCLCMANSFQNPGQGSQNSAYTAYVSHSKLVPCCSVEPEEKPRMGIVITARVHPGETNSSWIMQGLIDFLISECAKAKVSKIIESQKLILRPGRKLATYKLLATPGPNWPLSCGSAVQSIAGRIA